MESRTSHHLPATPQRGAGFLIGEWHYEPQQARLTKAAEQVELTPQINQVLVALADAMGEVVTTQQLLAKLNIAEDTGKSTLYQVIAKLRKIFYDTAQAGKYIATVPKKGYRLAAKVEISLGDDEPSANLEPSAESEPAAESEPTAESEPAVVREASVEPGLVEDEAEAEDSVATSTDVSPSKDKIVADTGVQKKDLFADLAFVSRPAETVPKGTESDHSESDVAETITGIPAAEVPVAEVALTNPKPEAQALSEDHSSKEKLPRTERVSQDTPQSLPEDKEQHPPKITEVVNAEPAVDEVNIAHDVVPPTVESKPPRQAYGLPKRGLSRWLWPLLLLILVVVALRTSYVWQPKDKPQAVRTFDSVAILPFSIATSEADPLQLKLTAKALESWLRIRLGHYQGVSVLAASSTPTVVDNVSTSENMRTSVHLNGDPRAEALLQGTMERHKGQLVLNLKLFNIKYQTQEWQVLLPLAGEAPLDFESIDSLLQQSFYAGSAFPVTTESCRLTTLASALQTPPGTIAPAPAGCFTARLLALTSQGNITEQVSPVNQLSRDFPGSGLVVGLKGEIALAQGLWQEAESLLLKAVELSPSHVEHYLLLAQIYRKQQLHHQSLSLLNQALLVDPVNAKIQYWRARAMVATELLVLGAEDYRRLMTVSPAAVKVDTELDPLRFAPFDQDNLSHWLSLDDTDISAHSRLLLSLARLSMADNSLNTPEASAPERYRAAYLASRGNYDGAKRILVDSGHHTALDQSMLLLAQEQHSQGLELLRNSRPEWFDPSRLIITGDNSRYLTSVANLLFATGQPEMAKSLLHSVIDFLNKHQQESTDHGLVLVESYALLGMEQQALARLAALINDGWLPDFRYRWWALAENPNLKLLHQSWQFDALVQLVNNRQQMLRLQYPHWQTGLALTLEP